MTGNYRVMGVPEGGYFAITGTQDNTRVTVKLSGSGSIASGSGIAATSSGGTATLTLNAGDVAELVNADADFSGSLVTADKPVQVIAGSPCLSLPTFNPDPFGMQYSCDHLEQSVFPAETLGKHYVGDAARKHEHERLGFGIEPALAGREQLFPGLARRRGAQRIDLLAQLDDLTALPPPRRVELRLNVGELGAQDAN